MEHHHFHYNQQQHHQHSQPEHELELEEWHQQLDLEHHIRHCQCSCNHMGYGNYWSYKVGRKYLIKFSVSLKSYRISSIPWRNSGTVTTCSRFTVRWGGGGRYVWRIQFYLFLCQLKPTAPVFRQSKRQSFWQCNLDFFPYHCVVPFAVSKWLGCWRRCRNAGRGGRDIIYYYPRIGARNEEKKKEVSCNGCWHVFLTPSGFLIFSWLVVFMYTKRMVPIGFFIAYLPFCLWEIRIVMAQNSWLKF